MKRRAAGRGQDGRSNGEGKGPADSGELRVDAEGRWQRMKLYDIMTPRHCIGQTKQRSSR